MGRVTFGRIVAQDCYNVNRPIRIELGLHAVIWNPSGSFHMWERTFDSLQYGAQWTTTEPVKTGSTQPLLQFSPSHGLNFPMKVGTAGPKEKVDHNNYK